MQVNENIIPQQSVPIDRPLQVEPIYVEPEVKHIEPVVNIVDQVMNPEKTYKQITADTYRDIATKSNLLTADGYKVTQVIPVTSGQYVILGEK
jgi:hypothetical protein